MDVSCFMSKRNTDDDGAAILYCSLFGPPQLAWAGSPLAVTRRQARALLYLLANDLRPTPRDRLVFLLWPDEAENVARRNLIRLLSYLRQLLPHPDLLLSDSTTVGLNPACVVSDTAHLTSLCTAEHTAGWERAVSLYRGRFLDGFSLTDSPEFDQWLSQSQRHYERAYLDLLRRLAMAKAEQGDYAAAIAYAQRYLATDDLAEEIHRQLITLYALQGDRAAALRQFEQCAIVLERELGAPPLPETRAAYDAVRAGRSLAIFQPPAPPRWTTLPSLNLPLVGREEEWQRLTAACRRRRRGGVVLIAGEAGVGKSRLMQEVATAQGMLTLTGANHATAQSLPYQPLTQALRQALALTERWRRISPIWLAELVRLLPEMQSYFSGLPRPVEPAPQQAQARLFEALTQIFFGLAGDSPLLLCLDDIHWADDATLGWLAYVTTRLAASGICIFASYRTQEAGRLVDWQAVLNRAGIVERVQLTGLSEEAVVELLRLAGMDQAATQWLSRRIHAATGGNAFFVLETIRELLTMVSFSADSADLPLPQTVRDAVVQRVRRLTPLAQQLLGVAAVLAPHLRIALLMENAGRSDAETVEGLEELLAHQLLRADGAGFRFQHDLARQAVYKELSPWRKRLLHQRAAESLLRLPAPEQSALAVAIADHFAAAGEVMQAIAAYRRAAIQAQRLYVHQSAIAHLSKAIELAQTQATAATILPQLYEALADNLTLAGRFALAEEAYRTALSQITADDSLQLAALQHKLAKTLPPQQRAAEAAELRRAALALLEERDERFCKELRLEILLGLMGALYYQLQVETMAALEGQIRTLLEEVGTPDQHIHFNGQLNQMAVIRDRYRLSATTVVLSRAILSYAQEAGDPWQIAHARFGLGFNLLWHGDLSGAEVALGEALAQAGNLNDPWSQTQCLVYLTVLYRLQGDTARMELHLPRLAAAGQTAGSPFYQAVFQANTAWLHYRRGHLLVAQAEAQAARTTWVNSPYPFQWLAQWIALAVALEQGTLADAVEAARALLDPRQQQLPDDVAQLLDLAVKALQSSADATAQAHLRRAVQLALGYGYL